MILGIDGKKWYASNGLCLGDPRAHFEFGDTSREVIEAYHRKDSTGITREMEKHARYLDMNVAEYREAEKIIEEEEREEEFDNGQFGVGA